MQNELFPAEPPPGGNRRALNNFPGPGEGGDDREFLAKKFFFYAAVKNYCFSFLCTFFMCRMSESQVENPF